MNKLKVTNDYVFKKIFGKKGNESILKDFLIAVLEIPIEKIEVLKDAHLEKSLEENTLGILDIKATLNNNIIVNIEMQVKNQYNIKERSLYYWSNLYSNNLYKNQDYIENNKTITINILDFNVFKEGPYHEKCKIMREYNKEVLTEDLEIHFIQIPKCKKENIKTKLDYWMQFIGNISKEGVEKAMEVNKEIKKAQEELEYLTGDEEERRIAELREKAIRDEKTNLRGAREEGMKEGIKEGREAGMKEGRAEGEKNKQLEIAKKMKKMNMSIETIAQITGLTKPEIEEI